MNGQTGLADRLDLLMIRGDALVADDVSQSVPLQMPAPDAHNGNRDQVV
jgi:hypothetical protein